MPSAQFRRRSPARGPLALEIRTLLAAAGLPEADSDDRDRAHGVVVTDRGESVGLEWFTSRSLRRAAADEQLTTANTMRWMCPDCRDCGGS